MKNKIIAHAAKNYDSSPHKYTAAELDIIIKSECECSNCEESIFELDDFPVVRDGKVYCEECERAEFYQTCPICEESFETPQKPESEIFVLSKRLAKTENMKPGIYQVKYYPYFLAATGFGFDMFFPDAIQLVREIDIESILAQVWDKKEVSCDCICQDCFDKYTEKTRITTRWTDTQKGIHRNITERGAIRRGY